jgi:hypothetical protein
MRIPPEHCMVCLFERYALLIGIIPGQTHEMKLTILDRYNLFYRADFISFTTHIMIYLRDFLQGTVRKAKYKLVSTSQCIFMRLPWGSY